MPPPFSFNPIRNLVKVPLQVTNCFSLAALKILSLSPTFSILIMMCLGVGLFGFILLGTLCFLDHYVYILHQVRDVFYHYFFPIGFQFLVLSSSSGTPMMQILLCLKLSQRLLTLSSFFSGFFMGVCYSDWLLFLSYSPSH